MKLQDWSDVRGRGHRGGASGERRQVDVDGTQRRHDGQVEEGEAGHLHPEGGAEKGRGHGQQHSHRTVNPAPFPVQDLSG